MKKENIETQLNMKAASLTPAQKNELWDKIEAAGVSKQPVPSPYQFAFRFKKSVASVIAVVVVLLGVGGTATASESARPGDLLFPIDQAIEDVRLALARSDENEARLKIAFAEERLAELRSLLNEGSVDDSSLNQGATVTQFEAEADVFFDTTIVTVEINDRKTAFETTATTKEAVITEILSRFAVDRATIERVLDFQIEDRASRVSDLSGSIHNDDHRVLTSVSLVEELTNTLSDDDQSRFVEELIRSFDNGSARVEVRHDDDGDSRTEIRDGDTRIRIEEKDGEVEVRVRHDDDSDSSSSDSDEDDSSSRIDDSDTRVRVEVKVEDGIAEVRLEYAGKRDEFEAAYTSTDALITLLANRSGLAESTISSSLDLEIKN